MKVRHRQRPPLTPDNALVALSLYFALEEGLECCSRLTDRRAAGAAASEIRREALEKARDLAYVSRVTWESMVNLKLLEQAPEKLSPVEPLKALARVGYALTALAEEEPEPEALLSPAELDTLIATQGIEDWVAYFRAQVAAADEREAAAEDAAGEGPTEA